MATATMTADEYASRILDAWQAYIIQEERRPSERRPYTYASSYEQCVRKLVLYMTDGDKLPPFEPEVLAKFHRGKDRERNMKIDLARVGQISDPPFEVVGEQERFELRDHYGRVAIVGKVDFQIDFGRGNPTCPVECKDWNENLTGKINTFDDVMIGPWTRKGGYQLLCYLFGKSAEFGFLLLPRAGLPKLIPVTLFDHLDYVEDFLQKSESALDYRDAGTLPDFIRDASECKRCGFYGRVCNPPLSSPGASILADPELEAMLDRREELIEQAGEYDHLDKQVKEILRGVEMGVAGKYIINGKWGKSSRVELPAELKAQYTVTDPKGRFTLKITKA